MSKAHYTTAGVAAELSGENGEKQTTKYRTFDPPPEGFGPHTASDASLLRHGLARRPDPATRPRLARLWREALSRRTTFVKAELGEAFARKHRTARPPEDISPAVSPAQIPSGDWAGAMIPTPPDDSFEMVFGQWVVPTVLPKNPSGEELSLAFWVGLAGSVPNIGGQLLQAGVSAIVDSGQGSVTWQAWTEWYDDYYQNPARPISNFPVAQATRWQSLYARRSPASATSQ
jgi:hypothetical protein